MHQVEGSSGTGFWHIYANLRDYSAAQLDPLLRMAADDQARNVMIVAPDCRWLLHPYDGGMDIILESAAERDRLRTRFQDWLPAGGLL